MKNSVLRRSLAVLAISTSAVCAFAQTSGSSTPLDYTSSLTQFKTDVGTFFSTNAPLMLGGLTLFLGFGVVWRLMKRAAKSV